MTPDRPPDLIEVLNLGAGVQSSTVLLMSIRGELPKIDHAIFADTGWEPQAVYRQMDWLEKVATKAGVKVWRVSVGGHIKDDCLRYQVNHSDDSTRQLQNGIDASGRVRWGAMPFFVLGQKSEHGQIRRQCTYEYKIRPIELCIRRNILQLKPRQRAPKALTVRRWYGISFDERTRMRTSDVSWAENWYPLVERRMTRSDCLRWLHEYGYHEAPRSACIGCPYRHNREWLKLKQESPDEFEEACQFDEAIRNCGGMRGQVFIHADRIPLRDVNLHTDFDPRQQVLPGFGDECSGMCGV